MQLGILSVKRPASGLVQLTVLVTNGTQRTLNVVDASPGKVAFVIHDPASNRVWASTMINQLTINLRPGDSLTNTIFLTNPPIRFRLSCVLRDFEVEGHVWSVYRFLPKKLSERIVEWRRPKWQLEEPMSPWIE